jgi:hypothetical protein
MRSDEDFFAVDKNTPLIRRYNFHSYADDVISATPPFFHSFMSSSLLLLLISHENLQNFQNIFLQWWKEYKCSCYEEPNRERCRRRRTKRNDRNLVFLFSFSLKNKSRKEDCNRHHVFGVFNNMLCGVIWSNDIVVNIELITAFSSSFSNCEIIIIEQENEEECRHFILISKFSSAKLSDVLTTTTHHISNKA